MGKDRAALSMDFGVRVAAVVEREGALLLVRHQKPDRDPYWVLPGGRLEPGTEPTLREVRWVSVEELREIELLPGSIKERLLRDAGGGWVQDKVYVGSTDG